MLVLIAHGSRNEAWRRSLENLSDSLRERDPALQVRLAYMQFSGPTLEEIVEEGREQGLREFRLLPLFMASAGHVDKDIRPLVESLAQQFPDVHLLLLPPVGEHPLFFDLIHTIAGGTASDPGK